ncbi:hypothetical protein [Isoptericola croceus]|uniref:hypothetical protein n=1 Tax=Isoptericola croceus TaxID=3031406 RepID=UPI0023FA34A0|nr:hypothetical protein [Isoptericola croceus]
MSQPSVPWEPAPEVAPVPQRRTRPRGRAAHVTAVVLAVLLVGALVAAGYLWRTTSAWEDHAAQWEAEAHGYAEDVASLQAELDGVTAELVAAREQLDTATARITDLADEKAQLGDENVASQQYLDYQRRVSEAAGVVATALGQCTAAQSQLIGYLEDREAYDPEDLERFASDVEALCDEANDANTRLQQELAQ